MAKFRISGREYEANTKAEAELMHDAWKRKQKERPPAWKEACGNVSIVASNELEDKGVKRWININSDTRTKLTTAVKVAPVMVREVLRHLKQHVAQGKRLGEDPDPDLDVTEVGLGLLKYFNIEAATTNYWRFVEGIISVYERMQEGLASSHTIELGVFDARGRVEGLDSVTRPVSPIREAFGFADEWGHVPYTGWGKYGNIQLNYNGYVCDASATFDKLARTIVHESSHRWAMTKDVLYKHQTFGKSNSTTEEDKKLLKQNQIQVPNRQKPLTPMFGREKGSTSIVLPERWLENADSFAWLARRLWKKSGSPGN